MQPVRLGDRSAVSTAAPYIGRVPHIIDSLAGVLYRFGPSATAVFPDGWGDRLTVEMLANPESITQPVAPAEVVWGRKEERVGHRVIRGQFTSPIAELLPLESRVVPVELVEPAVGSSRVAVLLPAWNDHGFEQRRKLAALLFEYGISSLMFDIPLYGGRRITTVQQQAIRTVADFALDGVRSCPGGEVAALESRRVEDRGSCGVLDGRKPGGNRRSRTRRPDRHHRAGSLAFTGAGVSRRSTQACDRMGRPRRP